jgi:hypothetical protein
MKIGFQLWITEQHPSQEALECFEESFLCYRVGAYRAALLFSYVGFQTFLRERIIAAPAPAGITAARWNGIQGRVQNDDTWDQAVFDTTQQRAPAPIFLVTEDVRHQMMYWKNRRNDCAHSKDNIIEPAHVEGIWAFIRSNLQRFVVNGSRAVMLTRIADHFNPALTPPGLPPNDLVAAIPHSIAHAELPAFFGDLSVAFDAARTPAEVAANQENPNKLSFFDCCLRLGDPNVRGVGRSQIVAERRTLLPFLRAYPAHVPILEGNPPQVRRLWNEDIFTTGANDLPVLTSCLRNNLIPEGEVHECLSTLIRRGIPSAPNEVDDVTLDQRGFYQLLQQIAADEGLMDRFVWGNLSSNIIVHYLTRSPITVDMARAIYHTFDAPYNPRQLRERLNNLFATNAAKRDEYLQIENTNADIGLPACIPALQ